jgi:hypothetical protein
MAVTFNSVTMPLARVRPGPLPTRDKVVEFPGNDGVEVLPMGKGAREIVVQCVSSGSPSRADLEGMMDDEKHTLAIDGDSYGNCRCVSVAIADRVTDASTGGMREYYVVTFRQEEPD